MSMSWSVHSYSSVLCKQWSCPAGLCLSFDLLHSRAMHRGDHSDKPGTQGLREQARKGLLQWLWGGVATAALFSVDINTKSICPNPQGQSAHITKFPLAGISRCPSVKPEPCVARVNTKGKKCPRITFQGGIWALPAPVVRKACCF